MAPGDSCQAPRPGRFRNDRFYELRLDPPNVLADVRLRTADDVLPGQHDVLGGLSGVASRWFVHRFDDESPVVLHAAGGNWET